MCVTLLKTINLIILVLIFINFNFKLIKANTFDLITNNNYPIEIHQVNTVDGYILNLYRIPDTPKQQQKFREITTKPVVLLLHGFALTSDAWILGDTTQSLAFLLADAGCDVWLGNQRGNTYSRQHFVFETDQRDYWDFSWHEIGYYDLAAMFDYILSTTAAMGLHYVGYSQGSTVLLVLLSMRPEYSLKLKTTHFLAPVAFMENMRPPFAWLSSWLHPVGVALAHWFGYREVLSYTRWPFYREICELFCGENFNLNFLCNGLFQFIGGTGSPHINKSLLPAICASHPAGASTKQILHFLQVYNTGKFQQYDYGESVNLMIYKALQPPTYKIDKISNCITLYYSDNDSLAAAKDVILLAASLRCAKLRRIQHTEWNHYDFLWSQNVKDTLWNQIILDIKNFSK